MTANSTWTGPTRLA